MERECDHCGELYVAKRSTSRFCSPTCRKRSSRRPSDQPDISESSAPGSVFEAAQRELRTARAESSTLGQAALRLAALVDLSGPMSGAAAAALVRELRATLAEAVKVNAAPTSLVDELRKRREQRGRAS